MKRLLVLSDPHCGHLVGLTPPAWQVDPPKAEDRTKREKYSGVQREAWSWFKRTVRKNGPYDAVVVNGDAIDGKGERSGGTELITTDRHVQVEMAAKCLEECRVGSSREPEIVLTYGTPYHTGVGEDFENTLADKVGAAKIGAHEWIDVEGVVFDFKHFIGSSSVPHGRTTAIEREALWAKLWTDADYTPRANVIVRSHVHYCKWVGDEHDPSLRVVTPALQAMGSKHGARKCSGLVSFGLVIFECHRRKITRFEPVLTKLKSQVARVLKI